jgi:hypothetical protein
MIPGFDDREQFAKVLHENLRPTRPIESQEYLYARTKQVQQIEQALYAPGRSIFVYGDRGVGKTSLAHTVAFLQQSADRNPVFIACGPSSTFSGVMSTVIASLKPEKSAPHTTAHTAKLGYNGIGFEVGRERREHAQTEPSEFDLTSAVAGLLQIENTGGKDRVIVIDEFDRIQSDPERGHFADFIKQIGDQQIPFRFVFCGVSASMEALLGAHQSCFRYLEGVELQRLPWEGRFQIIDTTAKALKVEVDYRAQVRIASISDGFPYYVHLICEKLFWQMFNDEANCQVSNLDHYREAVSQAVLGIEQHLKATYEKATMKDAPGYEQVLWAVADHADLIRNTDGVWESYVKVTAGGEQLGRVDVTGRLTSLKGASCGQILISTRRGWYQFRESMMRGYVRLRAEEKGAELATDYAAASQTTSGLAWPARGARQARMTTRSDWDKTKEPSEF